MRVSKVLRAICGFTREVVIIGVDVVEGPRRSLRVHVRPKARRRGRCGRCGELAVWYDQGDGARRWRHLDAGYATVDIVAVARRVDCRSCGPTVAQVPWARHDTVFTRAFEDLVVHDAIVGNKQAAADRYGVTVPLEILESPYRDLTTIVINHLDELDRRWGHDYVTVVIPEFGLN